MSKRTLYISAVLYLLIPLVMFLVGWTYAYIGIPVAILAISLLYFSHPERIKGEIITGSRRFELAVIIILGLWVLFSGIGVWTFQLRWDHAHRNSVFKLLSECKSQHEGADHLLVVRRPGYLGKPVGREF